MVSNDILFVWFFYSKLQVFCWWNFTMFGTKKTNCILYKRFILEESFWNSPYSEGKKKLKSPYLNHSGEMLNIMVNTFIIIKYILLHCIQFLMNSYIWKRRNNDRCFSNGPDYFCPTSEKRNKKEKMKKKWGCRPILFWANNLNPKKGLKIYWIFTLYIYIYIWTKIKVISI